MCSTSFRRDEATGASYSSSRSARVRTIATPGTIRHHTAPQPTPFRIQAARSTAARLLSSVAMHVLVLGAGFGGLELSTTLSEELGGDVEVTLIDQSEGFVFGF